MHLQKCHYLSEFLILREILNFFQKRISRRFIWNRPHRPIGRPNWPNRPFFEWKEFFFSKSMKMTQFRAKLCRPEVADVSNLGREYIQLVPKLLLHTQNVVISILHLYLWKNMCFISFFFKNLLKNWKKIHIFSAVNPLEKKTKKFFFQVENLINFFCKKSNFGKYLTSYFGLMKKYQVNKKFYNFEKKIFFENFLWKKNSLLKKIHKISWKN